MSEKKIFKCKNNHYFLDEICPICGEKEKEKIEKRDGDCISCGQLCPNGGYGCDKPFPIKDSE